MRSTIARGTDCRARMPRSSCRWLKRSSQETCVSIPVCASTQRRGGIDDEVRFRMAPMKAVHAGERCKYPQYRQSPLSSACQCKWSQSREAKVMPAIRQLNYSAASRPSTIMHGMSTQHSSRCGDQQAQCLLLFCLWPSINKFYLLFF